MNSLVALNSILVELTEDEIREAKRMLGREPNNLELAMIDAEWSEHCSYKSSKPVLKQLPTKGPRVIIGPGYDAGVVDVGDGYVVTLHIESHNHPSAIDPYGGAATGIGGVLRDILCMGTRPIALLDSLRFGNIEESTHSRWLFKHVVRGISDYGNCIEGKEYVYISNSGDFIVQKFEDLFNNFMNSNKVTVEFAEKDKVILKPKIDLYALSYDFKNGKTGFAKVNRLYRRRVHKLIRIKTTMGRGLNVTPDHPVVLFKDGHVIIKPARQIMPGDQIPILCDLPNSNLEDAPLTIDIIEELVIHGLVKEISVRPKGRSFKDYKIELIPLLKKIGVKSNVWCNYFKYNYMPLSIYLEVEKLSKDIPIKRADLLLYPKRGRINPIPSNISVTRDLARLIGYYLSEGCQSKDVDEKGATSRIIWTFKKDETEYINNICTTLDKMGIRYSVRQNSLTTMQIRVSSKILGFLLQKVLKCGWDSYSMRIPTLFFKDSKLLEDVLIGILRGDAHVKTGQNQSTITLSYSTVSGTLFHQLLLILQAFGYVPECYISYHEKSTVPLFNLEIHGAEYLGKIKDYFSTPIKGRIRVRLQNYSHPEYAGYRHTKFDSFAIVKVVRTEELTGEFDVYNMEVNGTNLYVTSTAIITHNCVGVPTVAGEVEFDDCFERNCLVDVVCLGLGKINDLVLAEAKHPNDSVILVGGSTGRDGIHGVTFASRVLTEKSDDERSAVQIPDPFMKKLIIEATLEAIATGHVRGLKDLGGGGLTCGLSEMADKGGCGIDLELSRVHLREKDLSPIEIMISESQERMVFIIEQGHEKEVCEIFDKYELPYSIIGKVTDSGKLIVKMNGSELASLPAKVVANAPIIYRKAVEPNYIKKIRIVEKPSLPSNLSSVLLKMLSCPSIASKSWVYEQYDHEVGIRTVVKPGQGDASVLRLPNGTFLAIKADGNSKHCYIDPYNGSAGCLSEACRNLVSVGAEPLAFVDHLQFGNPGNSEVFWTFKESVRGLADYSKAIGLPCIGGKVSFYNEDKVKNMAIKPSPVIAAIGRIEKQEWIITMNFKHYGNHIVILGETKSEMGGSEYYEYIHGLTGGIAPRIDFDKEKATMHAVLEAIRKGLVKTVHDVSKGGIAVALAEMCISGSIGASIDCTKIPAHDLRIDELLFSETHSRFVIETDDANIDEFLSIMKKAGIAYNIIGKVGGDALKFNKNKEELMSIPLSDLKDSWLNSIPKFMGDSE